MKKTFFFFAMSGLVLTVVVSLLLGLGAIVGMMLLIMHLEKVVFVFVMIAVITFICLFVKEHSGEVQWMLQQCM
jgi:hypothetical protein